MLIGSLKQLHKLEMNALFKLDHLKIYFINNQQQKCMQILLRFFSGYVWQSIIQILQQRLASFFPNLFLLLQLDYIFLPPFQFNVASWPNSVQQKQQSNVHHFQV